MATHSALAVSRIPVKPRLQSKSAIHSFPAQCSSKRLEVAAFSGLRVSSNGGEASFFDAIAAQITPKAVGTSSPVRGETVAKLKVAINGFGRIGRNFLRCWHGRKDSPLEVVVLNDSGGVKNASHLLKYDSMLGTFKADVKIVDNETISVDGKLIKVVSNRDPLKLPWAELGIDIVIEGTGVFVDGPGAGKHIQAGASKVIITAPAKGADIPTYVVGVNEQDYSHDVANIISNASCTTNCLAPFAKVLDEEFGIVKGTMTTTHSYTGDQRLLDASHRDLRRARAAALNIVPTSTGAAKAVSLVLPQLKGKLNGIALRVPTPNVSVVDLVINVEKKGLTAEDVNEAFRKAAAGPLKGVLEVCDTPLVSCDFRCSDVSGDSCSLDYLIDSIFPLFRKHIEPDLHHAQIRINNSFVSSFREAIYKLKCKSEIVTSFAQGSEVQKDNFIEMYLRPPSANEEARINDWIKVRQAGIRYYLSLGDQRIVDKHFIIRPKAEFEVGRMTLGGLLALGYNVVVSYKRASTAVSYGNLSLSRETIDTLGETFLVLRGTDRKSVGAEALRMGISGPWITKSYLELILESKGVPRLNTPPLLQQSPVTVNQEKQIVAPKPIRTTPNIVTRLEDLSQPWTRSPTKSQMEPMVATWHFTSFDAPHSVSSGVDSSFRDNIRLVPMPDSYDLDRGLLLSVQAIQALLENKGPPVIVGIGGPSGSGKTSLAHKMANIVGCEVVSLESYFKSEQVKDFKHDDFSSLDLPLLSKNIADITNSRRTKLPVFDLETGTRCGFKELEVSEECGVIIFEGVYALHPEIRQSLDLWVAVVGGVHSHLISRVQRDKSRVGCFMSQNEIMMTVFPMFQQHIEPHLVHAHVKIRNDFDPVFSPESSLFVLKSNKQVPYQDILSILDSTKFCSSVQNFIDIYFRLSGLPANGQLSDSDCIRVRICEGRFAVLIREPIREGNFIVQPKVDFDISVSTVAGLLNLGYQAVAYIEASAFIYQDGKILIEVDHLQDVPSPYIQIKGVNKKAVTAAGSALKLDGSYTTKSYLQIVLERLPPVQRSSSGIHTQQAARLQELVEFIQSQGSSNSASEASPRRDGSSIDNVLDDMQSRIKRLERWHTINTVLWTFLMSALVGYSLYQRKRQ